MGDDSLLRGRKASFQVGKRVVSTENQNRIPFLVRLLKTLQAFLAEQRRETKKEGVTDEFDSTTRRSPLRAKKHTFENSTQSLVTDS